MGSNQSHKTKTRNLSAEPRQSRDLLQGNALRMKKVKPKT